MSGSIKKSNSAEENSYWTDFHLEQLRTLMAEKDVTVGFLNPAHRTDDLSDELSLFGRDMLQVYLSDCVLADCRERRGIGVGYEMAFANFKAVPVVSWTPTGTHYKPKKVECLGQDLVGWTHPFVKNPSVVVVEDLKEAVEKITSMEIKAPLPIAATDFVFPGMIRYLTTQFERDEPMQLLVNSDPRLIEKVKMIRSLAQSSTSTASIRHDSPILASSHSSKTPQDQHQHDHQSGFGLNN